MTRSTILAVEGLCSGYGRVPVLHGVDLTVSDGEVLGILGHNGMGKTTLMRTLMGIGTATAGSIVFDGTDVTRLPPNERNRMGLAYVPQGRGIFPHLSVLDNLRMGVAAHDDDEDQAIRRILEEFPRLERLLERDGGELSGGEQQLLAIARALASEPQLVLLDEPTEGIQPSIVDEISDVLEKLNRKRGISMVLVEQSLEFITGLSSRIALMQKGEITRVMTDVKAGDPALINEFVGFGAARAAQGPAAAPAPARLPQPRVSLAEPAPVGPAPVEPARPRPVPRAAITIQEGHRTMNARRPTQAQLKSIVSGFGMNMSDQRVGEFLSVMDGIINAYDTVDAMPDYLPPVDYPRTAGYRPTSEENPLNAWYVKTEVRGAPRGPLVGRKVVLKDNVCLAGVPMMNGASTLKGYTPDVDATVVTRLLDAGATIVGKAHCEYFCLSGGSHTNATGPVHNPHRRGYSAGGSSSGSAALVGSGEVEMAIGGDQGGSIRMPASFSGCYGMKPTHGLVPYTGIMPIEATIDHTGPMTTNVHDNALMLEAIAGEDGLDPRQYNVVTDKYTSHLGRGVSGLRIGVVKEGFGLPSSEAEVDAKVRQAAAMFKKAGATVDEISVPMHLAGTAIWTPIAVEGLTNQMMKGNGMGTGWKGMYTTSLLDYHANWRSRADELSDSLKVCMFVGQYFLKHHRGHYYAKSQNLARRLKESYDAMLKPYDLLLMPTTPMKATPLPPPDATLALYCQRAFEMIVNTAPFDITGHPAMSLPCGMVDGLPVGVMLVGRHYEEGTIYRAAAAFEQAGDWKRM